MGTQTKIFKSCFFILETRREGDYSTGDILFISETNNVNVEFTSDDIYRYKGFMLDVQSISCADRKNYPHPEDFNCHESVQEVLVATDQFLHGVLVVDTESDGLYPNHACQNWNIITDENRVYYLPKKINLSSCISTFHGVVPKHKLCNSLHDLFINNIFQCIVISVGNEGFTTESGFDFVLFNDSNTTPGMTLHYLYQWQIYGFKDTWMKPLSLD